MKAKEELIQFSKSIILNKLENINQKEDSGVLHRKLDSLNSLQNYLSEYANTYTFDTGRKIIILNLPTMDSVYGVFKYPVNNDVRYVYIKLNGLFYKIKPCSAPLKLEPVISKEILKELQKI